MKNHYLLWATGRDKPGIVATVTHTLFQNGCNLEDSSMMRLGSEFAILLILTSPRPLSAATQRSMSAIFKSKWKLDVGFKSLSAREAAHAPARSNLYMVAVHGPDHPGIVYRVAACLAKHKFNITDLATHRTTQGKKPGYILMIEGELQGEKRRRAVSSALQKLGPALKTRITFQPVPVQAL